MIFAPAGVGVHPDASGYEIPSILSDRVGSGVDLPIYEVKKFIGNGFRPLRPFLPSADVSNFEGQLCLSI